jgi:aminoglycoside 6'-N-acetyltransferase
MQHPMRDGDLELRRFRSEDAEALSALFAEPEVKRWWADSDYDRDRGWVVEMDGEFAGWVQYEEEPYEWYPSVALDIALSTAFHGRGYGRVGVLRSYGRNPDGGWHDGLLMDLIVLEGEWS